VEILFPICQVGLMVPEPESNRYAGFTLATDFKNQLKIRIVF